MDDTITSLDEPEILRNKYPDSKRKNMPASAFCGPNKSFPVTDAEDVIHASQRLHNASGSQASIKACVIGKAKANGWKLPDTWTEKSEDRTMTTDLERAKQQAVHPPFTGSHSHGHPHEIDGYAHEHEHVHANDNMHDHTHMHHRAVEADAAFMYVPITRIDKEKWEVEGQATSDAIDHYGTIFDYDSSKRAFQAWRGNIREMHDPKKAVGRSIDVVPNDETRTITVRAFVSKGARDTWEKVCDGTLSGFSIGVPKDKYKVKEVQRNGKSVPMYYDHELAELSLVDNPGSPGCNIAVVRADGVATDVLDDSEEPAQNVNSDVNRAGARISHVTQDQLHSMRNNHARNLKSTMDLCGCDGCMAGCSAMDPDGDGDIDIIDELDYDGDGGMPDGKSQNMSGGMHYAITSAIERQLNPMLTRVNAMLSSYAARPQIQSQPVEFSTEPLERRIADVERAFDSRLTEVRSLLSEVKGLAEKIAAQPMPGGPVMPPVEKRLATSPQPGYNSQDDIVALTRASQLVPLSQEDQIALAAEIIKRQPRG